MAHARPDGQLSQAEYDLRESYRFSALTAALRERKLADVVRFLRAAGVEPLLVKGWSIARAYPQLGLRPYIDFDLYVRPREAKITTRAMAERSSSLVDLHLSDRGLVHSATAGRKIEQLVERSRLVPLGDSTIRIPAPEDELRVLAVHFANHGGWRPLWLCDVAVALENVGSDFDWAYCLGAGRERRVIAAVIELAGRRLGATASGPRVGERGVLPSWLVDTVLTQWGLGRRPLRRVGRQKLRCCRTCVNPLASSVRFRIAGRTHSRRRWRCVSWSRPQHPRRGARSWPQFQT